MASYYEPYLIHHWLSKTEIQTLEARDSILYSEDFTRTCMEIIAFAVVSAFHCKPDISNRVLGKLFKIPEIAVSSHEQLILELLWRSFSGRPENTPWAPWDNAQFNKRATELNPESVAFYEFWTTTDWIETMQGITIGPEYDAHQWKDSTDPWSCAISARVLCKTKDNKPPSPENLREAFDAMDKLFTQLPPRGENMPHGHIFSPQVYFILAKHLGHLEKALASLKMSTQLPDIDLHNFVDVPAAYEFLATSIDNPPIDILSQSQLEEIGNTLCTALDTRFVHRWKKPLRNLPMAELLSRFTKAAFFVHRDEYVRNDIHTPEDILYMPITPEKIAEIEQNLGPLPPDIKEIALIADGFCGGWHFAGGGWPGIENLANTPAENYEIYLGYEPVPERKVEIKTRPDGSTYEQITYISSIGLNSEDRGWGDVLVGYPDKECDDFEHLICPPSVWKKFQEKMGKEISEGEYAYLHFAHWTDGADEIYSSVAEWIANMTMELERQVAIGFREEAPE